MRDCYSVAVIRNQSLDSSHCLAWNTLTIGHNSIEINKCIEKYVFVGFSSLLDFLLRKILCTELFIHLATDYCASPRWNQPHCCVL